MVAFADLSRREAQRREWRAANPGPLLVVTTCRSGGLLRVFSPSDVPECAEPTTYHYVGRATAGYSASALASPFYLADESRRGEVLRNYAAWLRLACQQPGSAQLRELKQILAWSLEPRGLALACWCAPRACHADIVIRAVNLLYRREKENVTEEG